MNHKERRKLERQNKFKAHVSQSSEKQAAPAQEKQKPAQQAAPKKEESNEQ